MRISNTNLTESLAGTEADMGTAALIASVDHQQQVLGTARTTRQAAQESRIGQRLAAAEKLREMAEATAASGWLQLGVGLTAVGAGLGASVCKPGVVQHLLTAGRGVSESLGKGDWFPGQKAHLEHERALIEVEGERAQERVGRAQEQMDEAKRLIASTTQQLEKYLDAKHAASMAAIRG
ncbi:MAG: hypothetical protein IT371_15165 [Deltaproteobacteria bacterium]|nr:hypothetical protein [Deltaproteobacteria bacterium]